MQIDTDVRQVKSRSLAPVVSDESSNKQRGQSRRFDRRETDREKTNKKPDPSFDCQDSSWQFKSHRQGVS